MARVMCSLRQAIPRAVAALVVAALLLACRSGARSSSSSGLAAATTASAGTSAPVPSAPVDAVDAAAPLPPPADAEPLTRIAWQPRGHRAALLRGGAITLVDPARPAGALAVGPLSGAVENLVFSDDGAQMMTHPEDGPIELWSTATGARALTLVDEAHRLTGTCFSHDGKLLAASIEAGDQTRSLRIWDTKTGAVLPDVAPPQEISGFWQLAFLPDDRQLAGFDALQVVVWDIRSGKRTGGRGFETGATSPVALSPNGTFAATSLEQHALIAWGLGAQHEVHLDQANGCADHLNGVYFSRDSRTLIASSLAGRSASWNVPSLSPRSRWAPALPEDREKGTMSDDGAIVLHVLADGSAEILDAYTGRKIRGLDGAMIFDLDVSFSPDHRWVLQGGAAPVAWDVLTGRRSPL